MYKRGEIKANFEFEVEAVCHLMTGKSFAVLCRTSGTAVNAFHFGTVDTTTGRFKTLEMDSQRSKAIRFIHAELEHYLAEHGLIETKATYR